MILGITKAVEQTVYVIKSVVEHISQHIEVIINVLCDSLVNMDFNGTDSRVPALVNGDHRIFVLWRNLWRQSELS